MATLYILIILGHFVGDYLFQPLWMALGKSENTLKGYMICILHCLIYSLMIASFSGKYIDNPKVWALAFLSHFFIDKWSLAQVWLNMIEGRNVVEEAKNNNLIGTAFGAVVYTITDNTLHILILIFGIGWII